MYRLCAFLPLLGLLAAFLPDVRPPEHMKLVVAVEENTTAGRSFAREAP